MHKLLLAAGSLTVLAAAAVARDAPDYGGISQLLATEGFLDDQCRGGSGNDPKTIEACALRDELFDQIKARGWCFGEGVSIQADKQWARCGSPPPECTSANITSAVRRMISNMHYPLGGPQVQLFEMFEYRANPDLGGEPRAFVDTKSPCKVNIITDRGELGFTYNWRTINGNIYVEGQFGEPDE